MTQVRPPVSQLSMLHMSSDAEQQQQQHHQQQQQTEAESPRSNGVLSVAMFVDACRKQLLRNRKKKRKGSASASTVSLEPLVCPPSNQAETIEKDNGKRITTMTRLSSPKAIPMTKARSSSDISTASTTVLIDEVDSSASEQSLLDILEKAEASNVDIRRWVHHQEFHPARLMDNFVDFVAHQVVFVMNVIVSYNDAFADARSVNGENKILKKEFEFYSLVNSNILHTFTRITKLVNDYSQTIVCDVRERYNFCGAIMESMDFAKGLISNTLKNDEFFEFARKDNAYLYAFIGTRASNVELPLKVRRCLLGFETIHCRALEWFRRIPRQGVWK